MVVNLDNNEWMGGIAGSTQWRLKTWILKLDWTGISKLIYKTCCFLHSPDDEWSVSFSVCHKEDCSAIRPSCPAHKKPSVKQTECCDSFECICDCQNSTQTCTAGYITKEVTNDCGCVEVTCLPDKVGYVFFLDLRYLTVAHIQYLSDYLTTILNAD